MGFIILITLYNRIILTQSNHESYIIVKMWKDLFLSCFFTIKLSKVKSLRVLFVNPNVIMECKFKIKAFSNAELSALTDDKLALPA